MPINYDKLFALMEKKGIKKYDLRKMGISPTIVDRLVKNTGCEHLHHSSFMRNFGLPARGHYGVLFR